MGKLKIAINKSELEDLYLNQKLSCNEIASRLNICHESIRKRLVKFGISRRSISEGTSIAISHGLRDEYGKRNPHWKGGKMETAQGYIYILKPEHPHAMPSTGYIAEHILVWEEFHKKKLPRGWVVHHLNGIKNDNRPSNLLGLPNSKHNTLIARLQTKIRELEIENRQFRKALEGSQAIFYVSEN